MGEPFDVQDPFTWLDFEKKHHNKEYINAKKMENAILPDLRRVFAMIESGIGSYIRKIDAETDKLFDITKKQSLRTTLAFKFQIQPKYEDDDEEKDDKPKVKTISFNEFISKYFQKIPVYSSIVFKPNDIGMPPNSFNMWGKGFRAVEVKKVNMTLIQPILDHLRNIWCTAGDRKDSKEQIQEKYDYIISWFAHIVKFPHKQTKKCVLIYGEQGAGKSLIGDFFQQYICGEAIASKVDGIEGIVKSFNGAIKGKIFIKAEELTVTSDSYHPSFDKLKTLITDTKLRINMKGKEELELDNFCNFMFFTNNKHSIKVESLDRRYVCLDVSSCKCKDEEYFNKLGPLLERQDVANHFYTYLKNLKDSELANLNKIPETRFRELLKENSLSNSAIFLKSVKDGEFKVEGEEVGAKTLYNRYSSWCFETGEKAVTMTKFGRTISGTYIERIEKEGKKRFYLMSTIKV